MAFKDGITWASMWDEDGYLTEDGKLVAAGVYMLVAMIVLRFVREALIRAYPSNVHKFIPYNLNAKNKRNDVVCVDCTHPALPTLTHHKDSRTTPSHLRGDTSTDTVLNALTKTGGWEPMRVASKVTCNHFDIDGALSVWAIMNPKLARRHDALCRAAARLGDLREIALDAENAVPEGVPSAALRFCCWMNAVERDIFTRPFEGDEAEESVKKYEHFLPRIAGVLAHLDGADADAAAAAAAAKEVSAGDAERDRVLAGLAALRDATIERWDGLGACAIETRAPVHYYALHGVARDADAVVASYPVEGGGWAHEVELRYATFVEYQSRPTMPRFDLAPLAKRLNAIDDGLAGEQKWEVAGITDSGPLLRVNDGARRLTRAERYGSPDERPMIGSGFTPERFREIVRSYFDHGVRGAMKHLYVKRPEDVPRVGFWSWKETRAMNQTADWNAWSPP